MKTKKECPQNKFSNTNVPDGVLINEAQLLLAEKRTSMAVMRTGIAVFAIPMSILGLLIATSRYYDIVHVLDLMIPLVVLNSFLVVLGGYLVILSLVRIRRYDHMVRRLKEKHSVLKELMY